MGNRGFKVSIAIIFNYVKKNFLKLLISLLIFITGYFFNGIYYKELDYFNRDFLQLFNNRINSKISKDITLVDINTNLNGFSSPLKYTHLVSLINALKIFEPKAILLNIEPLDFSDNMDEKKQLYELLRKNKVFLNMDSKSRFGNSIFWQDPVFENFPYQYYPSLAMDHDNYTSPRRMLISYYGKSENKTPLDSLDNIGIPHKSINNFKYGFERMNTFQIFHKFHKSESFNLTSVSKILDHSEDMALLKDKIILIGRTDEFSFLKSINPFNFFEKSQTKDTINGFLIPEHYVVANQLNTLITGDYVKYLSGHNVIILICSFLIILIFLNISATKKLYVFILILPLIMLIQILAYSLTSFYIDLVPTYLMLIFSQYVGVPIIAFTIFKELKSKQLSDVNNARIDSLLSVSEKVAHDIRSPLGAINLILSRVTFSDPEHKEIVKNALKRIDDSAESILVKYKNKNDSSIDTFDKINIYQMLDKITSEKKILDTKIEYQLLLNETENVLVLGYSIELERVLSNILDNSIYALKKRENNATIKIVTKVSEKQIEIDICDNGIGISSSILKLLGNEEISTKRQEKGNGIGLLHAKRTIERMKGSFEIESVEGEFARVKIKLNLAT
jgi:signal transduction histidine kinase